MHVAVILDGNRRFARRLMQKPWKGHEWGAKKVRSLLEWGREKGIKRFTLYSLSIENIKKRPKRELDYLFRLFEREFRDILKPDHEVHRHRIRIRVIGRKELLPETLRDLIDRVESETESYDGYELVLAIAYGGQQEITDAAKKLAEAVKNGSVDPEKIDEAEFSRHLYAADCPDIIIRTGGEKRLSNFLLWQSAYSELFFVDKMWPEFEKEDFERILEEFRKRQRRFGG